MNDPCLKCGKRNASSAFCLPCTDADAERDTRKAERARIRKALKKAVREIEGLTPGEGGRGDVWVDAARNMYNAALRIVRR